MPVSSNTRNVPVCWPFLNKIKVLGQAARCFLLFSSMPIQHFSQWKTKKSKRIRIKEQRLQTKNVEKFYYPVRRCIPMHAKQCILPELSKLNSLITRFISLVNSQTTFKCHFIRRITNASHIEQNPFPTAPTALIIQSDQIFEFSLNKLVWLLFNRGNHVSRNSRDKFICVAI